MISEIYSLFAEVSADIPTVCGPGCATCCTRSVTLTTAEGRLVIEFLRKNGAEQPEFPSDRQALRPSLTTNGLAGCCLAGQEILDEAESPWLFEPCFLLRGGLCSIYEVRPFACRSFLSTVNCGKSGFAEAPELLVTLAIVTNQLLEHHDRGGWWGNLADVLTFLGGEAGAVPSLTARSRLLPNLPAPGLLVTSEEMAVVESYLARLGKISGVDLSEVKFR